MSLALTLTILAGTMMATVPANRVLGRAAGWPLAAGYLAATAAFLPAAVAVWRGDRPAWSRPWVAAYGVDLALRADGLGVVFTLIALVIGAVVFAYSARYLAVGSQLSFYLVMTGFTFAMVGLVLADDLVFLFVCWEITSLASFLLIARSGRAGEAASMRTLLITFAGGLALLAAVVLIVVRTGTTSVTAALGDPVWQADTGFTETVAVLVAIAGFTKAAQFPFHVWLADAMAAPTPVSAYLHAAAVVKAGIFVLLRFSPAFHATWAWNALLIGVGLVTAILGGRFALEQTDLKRLMAHSTVSQLGLIVATIGVGTTAALTAAVVHTIAHALFKSGLFMMVGVIDHAAHTRDIRRLPVLARAMPVAFAVTLAGCAAMAGIPPMLGFVSKESVFAAMLTVPGPAWVGALAFAGAVGASLLTFAYCVKIAFGGFLDGRGRRSLAPAEGCLVALAALPILAGLPLGLASGLLDVPVAAAAGDAAGRPVQVHFALWHGVSAELLATGLIFAAGIWFVLRRRLIYPVVERPTFGVDGPAVIAAIHHGVQAVGRRCRQPTAVDHASRHLSAIVLAFAVLVLAGVAALGPLPAPVAGQTAPVDVVLLVLITAAVASVCVSYSRLAATVALSAVGVVAVVQLLALGAPDVALTQLLVESLTVIVIMLVLQRLPTRFGRPLPALRVGKVLLAGSVGLAAAVGTWALAGRRARTPVAEYYLANAREVTGGDNIVNVILVEFRALDTLGELTVLGMAGVVVVAVLSTVQHRYLDPDQEHDYRRSRRLSPALRSAGTAAYRAISESWSNAVPLQMVLRVVNPLLVVVSAMIFWRGHNEPGGGFIAALVAASAVALTYLATSSDRQIGPPRLPLQLIAGGVVLAVLTGGWGLVAKGSFLTPLHGHLAGIHLTSSMVFDVGVYAAVLGLVMVTINVLGTSEDPADSTGERTRERVDESVEGELPGPMDTVRGERRTRVATGTRYLATGRPPKEPGR